MFQIPRMVDEAFAIIPTESATSVLIALIDTRAFSA
jgi:hypothetical protein